MDPYQEQILEHYKEPQNYGLLSDATFTKHEVNPNCGDQFTFSVKLNNEGVIEKVGFEGEGCAISTASASMLSEEMKGKTLDEVISWDKEVALELLGIELGPTRMKCALMPLQAVTRLNQ